MNHRIGVDVPRQYAVPADIRTRINDALSVFDCIHENSGFRNLPSCVTVHDARNPNILGWVMREKWVLGNESPIRFNIYIYFMGHDSARFLRRTLPLGCVRLSYHIEAE